MGNPAKITAPVQVGLSAMREPPDSLGSLVPRSGGWTSVSLVVVAEAVEPFDALLALALVARPRCGLPQVAVAVHLARAPEKAAQAGVLARRPRISHLAPAGRSRSPR